MLGLGRPNADATKSAIFLYRCLRVSVPEIAVPNNRLVNTKRARAREREREPGRDAWRVRTVVLVSVVHGIVGDTVRDQLRREDGRVLEMHVVVSCSVDQQEARRRQNGTRARQHRRDIVAGGVGGRRLHEALRVGRVVVVPLGDGRDGHGHSDRLGGSRDDAARHEAAVAPAPQANVGGIDVAQRREVVGDSELVLGLDDAELQVGRFEEGIATAAGATVVGDHDNDVHRGGEEHVEAQVRRRLHALADLLRIRAAVHVHQDRVLGGGLGVEARRIDEHGVESGAVDRRWHVGVGLGGHRASIVRSLERRVVHQQG